MKSILLPYSKVAWVTVISHLIVSLIFSLLYNFDLFNTSLYNSSILVFSLMIALVGGIVLGTQIKKRALVHAFALSCIWTIIALLFYQNFSWKLMLKLIGKMILFITGTALGRKIQNH